MVCKFEQDFGFGDNDILLPAHPLIHIALAADHSEGSPEAEFLAEFGVQRLPADARICALASRYLAAHSDFSRAMKAAEHGLQATPNDLGCLRGKLLALRGLRWSAEALALEDRIMKSEGTGLDDFADAANYAALLDDYPRATALLGLCKDRFEGQMVFHERKGFIL